MKMAQSMYEWLDLVFFAIRYFQIFRPRQSQIWAVPDTASLHKDMETIVSW